MKRKTIGTDPLDQLGSLKGRGKKIIPAASAEAADEVRSALLDKRPLKKKTAKKAEPSLGGWLKSAFSKLLG